MADNTILNIGTGGDMVAAEDVAGVKYQRLKLVDPTAGSTTGIGTSANPLRIDPTGTTAQAVTGPGALSYGSGQVNGLGNNTLITPAAGKKIRAYYLNYNPLLAVEAGFRFGAAGTLILRANVTANSVIAKDFGDFRYVEGAANEALILNLSLAVNVIWNAFYLEI